VGGIQEDRNLAITGRNHIGALQSLLIVSVMFIGILIWFQFSIDAVIGVSILWGIDAITSLYLHFEYMAKNKGEEYEVRDTELIKWKDGEETVYKNNEIEKIIVYLSPALNKNSNFHLLAIEGYHYAVVKLKTGEELILTCLLAPRIDKSLKQMRGVLFEKRKRLFCMI
jgi:5-bromo-4-chloroindolyl phosphate hydrolysis protein